MRVLYEPEPSATDLALRVGANHDVPGRDFEPDLTFLDTGAILSLRVFQVIVSPDASALFRCFLRKYEQVSRFGWRFRRMRRGFDRITHLEKKVDLSEYVVHFDCL